MLQTMVEPRVYQSPSTEVAVAAKLVLIGPPAKIRAASEDHMKSNLADDASTSPPFAKQGNLSEIPLTGTRNSVG